MPKRISAIAAFLCIAAVSVPPDAGAVKMDGVDMSYFDGDVDFASYEALYIDIIDLKDVKIEYDDEDNDESAGEPGVRDLEKIAAELHNRFYRELAQIMPIYTDETAIGGKKAIKINFKLVGSMRDMGMLSGLVMGFSKVPTSLSIECRLYDSRTGKELGWFTDSRGISGEEEADGFFARSDLDKWYRIMDYWAERFAKHMAVIRGRVY